ncbi:MAG: hypothetical protein ACRD1V_14625 [Vicinamibacterales bacterium]
MSASIAELAAAFHRRSVRAVLIGVYGANLFAPGGQAVFPTADADFLLPLDPDNLLHAWEACGDCGLELWLGREPLDSPHDRWLAERMVQTRSLTRARGIPDQDVDLTLVMAGFDFERVWAERRPFLIDGVEIQVASLQHIVASKYQADRPKDRLFLATHQDALEQLLKRSK